LIYDVYRLPFAVTFAVYRSPSDGGRQTVNVTANG